MAWILLLLLGVSVAGAAVAAAALLWLAFQVSRRDAAEDDPDED